MEIKTVKANKIELIPKLPQDVAVLVSWHGTWTWKDRWVSSRWLRLINPVIHNNKLYFPNDFHATIAIPGVEIACIIQLHVTDTIERSTKHNLPTRLMAAAITVDGKSRLIENFDLSWLYDSEDNKYSLENEIDIKEIIGDEQFKNLMVTFKSKVRNYGK